MRNILICGILAMLLLAACGKFDDPNIKDQYYVYLEDEQTGEPISDQVLYTFYKNGTAMCGYAPLNGKDECPEGKDDAALRCHEDACYKMVETAFKAQMDALKEAIAAQAAAEADAANSTAGAQNST